MKTYKPCFFDFDLFFVLLEAELTYSLQDSDKGFIKSICEDYILDEPCEAEIVSELIAEALRLPECMSIYIYDVIVKTFDDQVEIIEDNNSPLF